jgi:hypothetical protein
VSERIIQRQLVNRGTRTVLQVLIKWSGAPESLVTWEDVEPLHQRFPGAAAWGQAAAYAGGDVTTMSAARAGNQVEEEMDFVPQARLPSARVKKPNRNVYDPEWM